MFGELSPSEGEVRKHTHLRIAKYHQHSTDQVHTPSAQSSALSIPALPFKQGILTLFVESRDSDRPNTICSNRPRVPDFDPCGAAEFGSNPAGIHGLMLS